MAFDQSTRNRLQKFVSNARTILGEELTRQLQATYGLDPKQGTVAAIDSLTHLDNRQRQTAHLLRETLAHYLATTPGKGEKDRTKQVLDRIVREQAFTVLNRLAALRMAEARGFLLESIAKAHSSKGFQLYRQLSGTAHGETGDAYRNYLFSLFDEFSLDLALLFDRHSAQGRLFPRESALLELLSEINHFDIEHLWAEDETIGWIYQYFNSQEERKKMRAESQAPRNSRELAVRNQFFTPRYVVEFLTDNTLGRIWYEMTQGNTALVDSCRYLVRRPTEVFLKSGETAPELEQTENGALSQQELLKQPVFIPYRPLKDPRSIRMLDPACGSMHFGLYAFDLFESIYLEAWQLEQQLGPDAFTREAGQQALQSTFESAEAFKQQIPKLIIEHNIYGVDIDPRAVQIAGLSLWQRAQRAWYQQGIKPQQRPTIVKSNIVCAEPMPGEKALLQEFTSKLHPPVLGQLLEVIFDKMQLAGEAGTLLKIEEEIQTAIHEAREQWFKQSASNGVGDLFQAELDAATPQAKLGFDLRGIDDATFWDDAEHRILQALSDYADQAESNADQKRLFAEDAAKGFAFIDLCRKRFDVVLMNPPFGSPSELSTTYLKSKYPSSYTEIYLCFFLRAIAMSPNGKVAAITSRTWMNLSKQFVRFRKKMIDEELLEYVVELGAGVLDNATVETSATIISPKKFKTSKVTFFSPSVIGNYSLAENLLYQANAIFNNRIENGVAIHDFEYFKTMPSYALIHQAGEVSAYSAANESNLHISRLFVAKQGMGTSDDFRFVRMIWELPPGSMSREQWPPICLGDQDSKYYADHFGRVNWKNNAKEIKTAIANKFGSPSRTMLNMGSYFESGLTYQYTGNTFRVHPMRLGSVFSMSGQSIHPVEFRDRYSLLALLNAEVTTKLLKNINPGRFFQSGYVNSLPFPYLWEENFDQLDSLGRDILSRYLFLASFDERSPFFNPDNFSTAIAEILSRYNAAVVYVNKIDRGINKIVNECYGTNDDLSNSDLLAAIGFADIFHRKISCAISTLFGNEYDVEVLNSLETDFAFKNLRDRFSNVSFKGCGVFEGGMLIHELNLLLSKFISVDELESDLAKYCPAKEFSEYINNAKYLFTDHMAFYTKNRRISPIYWPLQTPSGSYTLWVYYHRLNEQTLYTCVNDFVEPKLTQVEQDLNGLRSKSTRSSQEEKELEKLSDLASELRDFRDELLRLAKFWKPNLNDGVQITAAPLWKLFQHKAWQKKLKETWENLEKGDYDWAHLVCSIWPERVLRKCHLDQSFAIAHDVENHFWREVEVPVKRGKKLSGETKLEWQPKELNEPALLAVIKQIKEERGL